MRRREEIARQHLITQLVQEAVKARLSGHPEVSRQKLEEALVLDPKNPVIAQHVEELANDQKMFVDQGDAKGVDAEGPIELTPASVKKSFHLKGTQQEILRQVLTAYQLTPVIGQLGATGRDPAGCRRCGLRTGLADG